MMAGWGCEFAKGEGERRKEEIVKRKGGNR